ncbi:MAG: Ribosome maturation factor RimM [Gammaproteobacteria bacterium]|nr:Ribosome maturation factor RimM [Gammaproteobacteria bacterium]
MQATQVTGGVPARPADDRYVILGKVSGLFGVQGWVRVHSHTRPIENILRYTPWFLEESGSWRPRELAGGRQHGKGLVARLAGIDDRGLARTLVGAAIAVKRSQLPAAAAGEYYHADLLGMSVVNREGVRLGTVLRIFETGAHDVLVVRGGHEHLIPLVFGVHVLGIDGAAGVIEVDWRADY